MPETSDPAVLLEDGVIYKRTARGQRALVRGFDDSSSVELRVLARVNGYTQLRQLIELAPDDARELARVLPRLYELGLVELVDPRRG